MGFKNYKKEPGKTKKGKAELDKAASAKAMREKKKTENKTETVALEPVPPSAPVSIEVKEERQSQEGGIPTLESRILACQCGCVAFDITKRTRTAISLVCVKCGLRASVKGHLATVRVRQQEIQYALAHTVVTPDESPEETDEDDEGTEKTASEPDGPEYVTLRFRILKAGQKDVIDKAMEAVRVANCSSDKFREQTWQGHALEYICADFLSGCTPEVLQIVEAMNDAETDAFRIAEKDGKPEPRARAIRDLRAKVRDKLACEAGILPIEMLSEEDRQMDLPSSTAAAPSDPATDDGGVRYEQGYDKGDDEEKSEEPEEPEEEEEEPEEKEEEEGPIEMLAEDGGRLLKAVETSLENYLNEATEMRTSGVDADLSLPNFLIQDGERPEPDLLQKWAKSGGYLLRIWGDERTYNDTGRRPCVCAWVAAEPADLTLDFNLDYDDVTTDILGDGAVEVVELLPPDYDEIEQWDSPHFADRREKIS